MRYWTNNVKVCDGNLKWWWWIFNIIIDIQHNNNSYSLHLVDVEYITSQRGKVLLILDGYKYSRYKENRWRCAKKVIGCKARLKMDDDGNIEVENSSLEHTHNC